MQSPAASARVEPVLPARRFEAERILVIRLGALGDVVRTRFAFEGVRALWPEAQIDWLVDDGAAPALDGIVGLRDALRLPRGALRAREPRRSLGRLAAFVRELRARRYDVALDFHGMAKSALLARASATPIRVGYGPGIAREGAWWLYTHRVPLDAARRSRFERNAALVRFAGGEVPASAPPLALPREVERALASEPAGLFALHPGTSASTQYKRWDPERFAAVARTLHERTGRESWITWGPVRGERETADEVVRLAPRATRLAPATPTIHHVLALYRRAALYVGPDSGPMHLASLAGLPVVALFGPTDPVENAPFPGLPSRVLLHDVGCNPCREGCPARSCMRALGVSEVVAAALALVAPPPALS
jgi:ADP-heptose:LPS heptosyltransferase